MRFWALMAVLLLFAAVVVLVGAHGWGRWLLVAMLLGLALEAFHRARGEYR